MASDAVVNASPLIYLARADLFHLLKLAGDDLVVTEAVFGELMARGQDDPTIQTVRGADFLRVEPEPRIPQSITAWDLGPGESSVITWAIRHPPCRAVIDDLQGRRCAAAFGVPLRGTLGLVLRAERAGWITSAREVLARLRGAGMYLSDRVIDLAVREFTG